MIRLLRTLSVGALVALVPCVASAATAFLVRDIEVDDTSASNGSSFQGIFGPLLSLGDRALFAATEETSSNELWTSDGRTEGTSMVSDICPGNCASQPFLLGRAGRTGIFLAASDEQAFRSSEIWRSDGTAAGTFPLVQGRELELCRNGFEGSAGLGGSLYFTLSNHETGCELWKSDGTAAGTLIVRDIAPGNGNDGNPANLVVFGGKLYFFASGPDSHPALWRSDGTEAGTAQVAGLPYDPDLLGPAGLTVAGSRLFFTIAVSGTGRRLWVSDGTAAGTRQITSPVANGERAIRALDGLIYFVADDGKGGQDLWRSDGTDAGTRQVTDFSTQYPIDVAVAKAGGRLLLVASNSPGGSYRLWVSGGTPATTVLFDGCEGGCPMLATSRLETVNGRVLFAGFDSGHGTELWSTDGTGAGTKRLRDICPGNCSSISSVELHQALGKWFFLAWNQGGFGVWTTDGATVRFLGSLGTRPFDYDEKFSPVEVGKKILFTAAAGGRPRQLWESDGSPEGTRPLALVGVTDPGSYPLFLTALGPSSLLFVACDGQDRTVWRSSGTEETTASIASGAIPCTDSRSARNLLTSGGLGYFLRDFTGPTHLWRTDGTDAGTFALPPSGNASSAYPVAFNGKVDFLVFDEFGAAALWETDGTLDGTRKRLDLSGRVRNLTASGPDLYFISNTTETTGGEQLWRTDGTAGGTRQVTSLYEFGYNFDDDLQIVRLGNRTFFVGGGALMATDGTPAGTAAVRAPDGKMISGVSNMVPFHDALYLFASTHEEPFEIGLWRTDGSPAGTALVARVAPHYDYRPDPAWFTVVGDQLFFSVDDGQHDVELWKTDGTTAGTVLVKDIFPGAGSSKPSYLTAAGGRLYFTANDGTHGFELWESDGTAAGTRMVQDLAPGGFSGRPEELTVAGNLLYFRADDSLHGPELWAYPLAAPQVCQPTDERLCLGDGRFQVEADWRDFQGNSGQGHAVSLTGDTGYFWFFDAANVEVVLKVLDGRGLNGHHWAFYGALSNVEYSLTITDVQTGAVRRYVNPAGRLGSVGDTNAFGPKGATGSSAPSLGPAASTYEPIVAVRRSARFAVTAPCAPSSARLCLNNGRFAVEARWRDFQGKTGTGTAVPLSGGDTGYFWFFNAANVEVVLKVLDGRALNGKFWVFYGALSNVEYELTVTDTETGTVKTYRNPSGRLASVADTGAF
jgi:ELWxxDGT repeat protein